MSFDVLHGAQDGGEPRSSMSPGRCAASSFTCAAGLPAILLARVDHSSLRRTPRRVPGLGMRAGAVTQVKEEAAQRTGDTE